MTSKLTFTRVMLILLLGLAARAHAASIAPIQPSVAALNRMQIYSAEALADVEAARSALHDSSAAGVATELDKTRTMLILIRSRLPAAEFRAMLSAMRSLMDFEDNKQIMPFFQKLFYALDDLPKTPATAKAAADLKQAQSDLRKPDRANAITALGRAESEFNNPILTPPLKAAKHDLSYAIAALTGNGNGNLTDTDLKKLAGDLIKLHKALATYPIDMPPLNVPSTSPN